MADDHKGRVDELSGVETTGHSWDGLEELNNPMPSWWLYTFYASIVFAIGYMVLYPSWPVGGEKDHLKGTLAWNARDAVNKAVKDAAAAKDPMVKKLMATDISAVRNDKALARFAGRSGKAAFGDNCAPCHGSGATGSKGYPGLVDDDWLWGGTLEQIQHTIKVGIRSEHDETRNNSMAAYGDDELLDKTKILNVASYVLSLSGHGKEVGGDIAAGEAVFKETCVSCHGPEGKGMQKQGAPNLSDDIWLFGGKPADVIATITHGRKGLMPTWEGRLDEATIKALAIYVHNRGGGQ